VERECDFGEGGGSLIDFSEQGTQESPGLKIVRKTDWQDNPVEDEVLTYSAPGRVVRLTTREVSSAGFAGTNFVRDLSLASNEETSQPFGLTAMDVGGSAMAKSQRVEHIELWPWRRNRRDNRYRRWRHLEVERRLCESWLLGLLIQ
jgi:hypothetical protein